MAQFDYLGTWADSRALLSIILERPNTTLVADLWYKTPEPFYIASINEAAMKVVEKRRHVFIWAQDFSRSPPFIKPVDDEDSETLFSLQPSVAGPCLDLSLPACYEQDGFMNLAMGILLHQSGYLNPKTREWHKATAELKAGYRDILARMKQYLIRHKYHKYIWTGPDALSLLQGGKARITGFGLDRPTTYKELMERKKGIA